MLFINWQCALRALAPQRGPPRTIIAIVIEIHLNSILIKNLLTKPWVLGSDFLSGPKIQKDS